MSEDFKFKEVCQEHFDSVSTTSVTMYICMK